MFKAAKDIEQQSLVVFDVCIIGAGAAGITLAKQFSGTNTKVALLEAGDFNYDEKSLDVYKGEANGYISPQIGRLRYFGGTTNHWSGYCRIPEPEDLSFRSWLPGTGWPLQLEELEPYLQEAASIVDIPARFSAERWASHFDTVLPHIGMDSFGPGISVISPPTRFGNKYKDALADSSNVYCFLGANVTSLNLGSSGEYLKSVTVRPFGGPESVFRAKFFVLACGGLENPRLLLNSNEVATNGVGNDHDLVGRYFSDHGVFKAGYARLSRNELGLFSNIRWNDPPNGVVPHYVLSKGVAMREQVPRCILRLLPSAESQGVFERLGNRVNSFLPFVDKALQPFTILAFSEAVPSPENRITLGSEVDDLGLRRLNIQYSRSELEGKSIQLALKEMGMALGRTDLGRIRSTYDETDESAFFDWGHHHIGTTRMHSDPEKGVVDAQLKIHGLDNLYIAGSSVFPNTGLMTPTMTLVALTLRLYDTLKVRMG